MLLEHLTWKSYSIKYILYDKIKTTVWKTQKAQELDESAECWPSSQFPYGFFSLVAFYVR